MEDKKGITLAETGGRLVSYEKKQRIKKYRRTALFLIIICVGLAMMIAYWNRSFNSYVELTSTPSSEGTNTRFVAYGEGYLRYSKDGISYLSQSEQIIWTEAYTMESPVVSARGDYAVLADLEGNDIHLYGKNGKLGDYSMSYPIKEVLAAEQGVFCVVLDAGTANYIRLYNKNGELLAEIKTQIENSGDGYPLDVAISSDGTKLVASLYRVEGIDSKNTLAFYNFGEGGKGQSGNLVGTYQFDDMLIPKVEFMDDETVCAVGDSRTIIYKMDRKPKKVQEILFSSEILSVFGSDKYLGYIFENPEEEVESGKKELYQINIYNKKGRLVRSFDKSELHETVQLHDNVIVSYSAGTCVMEKMDGSEIFRQDMGSNILDILPTNKSREFLMVYGERSSRIRLINIVDKEEKQVAETVE